MSKTVELQIEKGRNLVEGLRRHVKEMGERLRVGDGNREALATDRDARTSGMRGISNAEIDQLEQSLNELTTANKEVDRLREELQPKVKHMNDVLTQVKTTYGEAKKGGSAKLPSVSWRAPPERLLPTGALGRLWRARQAINGANS